MNYNQNALIIVDAQRGFMPGSEGERLQLDGFGELGVEGGETIVSPINELTTLFGKYGMLIATTQDFHPAKTAHFSDNPNFVNTWPVHCVGGTPGAELHPELSVSQNPETATRFIKGDTPCESPEDDDSYTGVLAYDPTTGTTLPDWLRSNDRKNLYVTGLALGDGEDNKLCVDSTAVDLHEQGFNVTVITDATEAVLAENKEVCFRNLGKRGITLLTTAEVVESLEA